MPDKYILTKDTAANLETLRAANGLIDGLEYHDTTNGIRYIATAANVLMRIEAFWKRSTTIVEPLNTGDTVSGENFVLLSPNYRDEYPAILLPAAGQAAPDVVVHTVGGVVRSFYGFDGGTTEERLGGSIEIPHDYMMGEQIEAHVHWRPATTGTGTVIWYFDWEYSPPDAAPIPQTTLSVEVTIASNKQYWHLLSTFGFLAEPATPFSLGGKIGFNIRRTPTTDTYAGDALLEQPSIHVPIDTLGSSQIYVK